MNIDTTTAGYILAFGLMVFPVLILASLAYAWWCFKGWWWRLTRERYWADTVTEAWETYEVRDEVETLYRKVHYRHNVHCPVCGRFAKRVPDLPEGVSDCKVHGIHMRTVEYTGMIDVEIRLVRLIELAPEPPAITNSYELPEIVIDYTDDDFVPDADGLPVFTRPLEIEEIQIGGLRG